ncbi:LOW QUALITY PROTEIN: hsp70-binding protein 1-like [Macrobrachium nipponense]|uniref:LOW QUALITY PROTEIN: hsp70-binding protein 1-like n=1 Tax=Macrobrachium nipponense TaxID=159736 RepID=UPI0030C86627
MSGENNEDTPRQPRNLQGLLNFCTQITAREDNTRPTDMSMMDPERRRFLEEALTGMTVDVVKKLAEAVKTLFEDAVTIPGENVEEQEEALDTISEYVEDLNYAKDLQKMGGFPALIRCLDSPHESLRASAANVIGEVCQNNLDCQSSMLALNPIPTLLHMMDNDSSKQAKVKALFALSCLVRGYTDGERKFLELDGFSYLMRAMQSGEEKLVVKSAFFLNNLIDNDNFRKDAIMSMGYVEQLRYSILNNDAVDNVSRKEHCHPMVLATLAMSYPPALSDCLRPEFNLPCSLRSRLTTIKGKSEFEDEARHITNLLNAIESEDENTCR